MTARQGSPGYDGNNADPTSQALNKALWRNTQLSVEVTRLRKLVAAYVLGPQKCATCDLFINHDGDHYTIGGTDA